MIVKSEKIEKECCFYVSDFHLEMILVPFLNKKIDNNEEVKIFTEKDLTNSIKVLISKINLSDEKKKKILNLDWNKNENLEVKNKANIIVIGKEEYIKQTNDKIKKLNINDLNIIDCYYFDDIKNKMQDIVENYDKSLNTLGNNIF